MKRYIALLFAIGLCFTASASPPEKPGAEITASSGGVRLNPAEPIYHLYIEWDLPPGPWELVTYTEGVELRLECGKNDFLHEYIQFSAPVERFEIVLRGEKEIKCRAYYFAEENPPDWVQRWKLPHDDADLLMLPVRAGDEFLYFGGAIPYYAVEKDMKVQLAYMTNLWMEPRRTHEALDALYAAGLRHYPIISDFQDTLAESFDEVVEIYDEDAVIDYNIKLIRRFRPEVVIGQGNRGDGMSLLCFEALSIANELCADELEYRDSAQRYGVFEPKKVYMNGLSDAVSAVTMDWSRPIAALSGKTALEVAEECFAMYSWRKSQRLETSGEYDCRVFGLYSTTVGEDKLGDDLFENAFLHVKLPDITPEDAPPETQAESSVPAETHDVGGLAPAPDAGADRADRPTPSAAIGAVGAGLVALAVLLRLKREW